MARSMRVFHRQEFLLLFGGHFPEAYVVEWCYHFNTTFHIPPTAAPCLEIAKILIHEDGSNSVADGVWFWFAKRFNGHALLLAFFFLKPLLILLKATRTLFPWPLRRERPALYLFLQRIPSPDYCEPSAQTFLNIIILIIAPRRK